MSAAKSRRSPAQIMQSSVIEVLEQRRMLATYYFDAGIGDDDYATNSSSTPWASIAKANTLDLNPGDQLLFKGGQTFSGSLSLTSEDAGTATNPVLVDSWGTGRATINGGTGKGIYIYNVAGIAVQNLILTGGWNATTQSGNTDSGINVYIDLAGNVKLDYLRVSNVEVSGFKDSGIKVQAWATDSSYSGFTNVTIENSSFHDNGGNGIKSAGMYHNAVEGYSHENFMIRNCTTYNNKGIAGSSVSGNGINIAGVDGATIERSIAYGNGGLNTGAGGGPVGIWMWDVTNSLIQFCESYNNDSGNGADGGGFDFDGGVTNSVMQYNYSHDNRGPGYLVYEFGGREGTSYSNTFRYNITKNDGTGMLISNSGSGGQTIYNNTIYTNKGTGISLWSGTHKIFNNIVVSSGSQLYVASASTSSQINGNDYYKINGGLSIVWNAASGVDSTGSTTYTTLASFHSATSKEASGRNVDPLLTDPANAGTIGNPDNLPTLTAFQLQSTSPLINAGLNLTQSPYNLSVGIRDFYGNTLPQGAAYDVGAHEVLTAAASLISSGRSATASSLESSSYLASNVTDGSLSSRWASQQGSDNQWIYIDLGGSYNVSQIRLHWETAAGRDYKLQIKASDPDVDTGWTDLQSITNNTTANAWLDYTGLSGTGRYVRMRATARATSWGYSIKEMEVYGTAVAAADTTAPTSVNNTGTSLTQGVTGTVITNTMLKYTDNVSAASAVTYTLTTLPGKGTLKKSGTALALNGTFTQDDLDNSRITYDNTSNSGNDSFAFTVRDAANNAASSATFNITVNKLAAPGSFTLTAGDGKLTVSWATVANATGYKIKYGTTSGSYSTTVDVIGGSTTSRDITSLTNGTTYYVIMTAYNAAGEGNATTESSKAPAAATGSLISTSKSATASSVEGNLSSFVASNVTDGSLSTRWASQQGSDNQWIYIDLGGSYNVSRIRLHWETAAGRDYKLQVKADNPGVDTGWTDLQSITSNTTANAWLDYTGLSGTGRYVRMRATARATSWGYSIKEFEVYGTAVAATPAKLSGTVIGTTGSWNNEGNTRDKAFDGDLNTFFDAPTGDGSWVGLDLGTAKTITSIKFAPRSGFASRMSQNGGGYFQVSNSADFSSATTIHTISTTPTVGSLTTVTVSVEGTWRYIRFVSPTGGYGNIAEFEAWGY